MNVYFREMYVLEYKTQPPKRDQQQYEENPNYHVSNNCSPNTIIKYKSKWKSYIHVFYSSVI